MRDFNRSDRSDRRGGGRGDWDRPQMFSAVCDECGDNCEVPFKPRGDKPIFCSRCFEKRDGGKPRFSGSDRRDSRDDRGGYRGDRGGDRGDRRRPDDRGDRRRSDTPSVDLEKLENRLAHMEQKLDSILSYMDPLKMRYRATKEDMVKLEREEESNEKPVTKEVEKKPAKKKAEKKVVKKKAEKKKATKIAKKEK